MDRQIVYPGQILPETTLLQMTKDAMIGLAKLSAAVLGTSTAVNGFAVTPTSPASLQVYVAPGEIYSLQNIDGTVFSSLAADTTHQILKQGILLDQATLSCPAPATAGQSINYLIEASYQDSDANPVLLPYYNSTPPNTPFSGQGNNGLTQPTARKGTVVLTAKAGVPATTGSQTTPAPDSGNVGLYVVTVAYGQTQIVAGNISQYAAAPFINMVNQGQIQAQTGTAFATGGTAPAYTLAPSPAIQSYANNQRFNVTFAAAGTTGSNTIAISGLGAIPLKQYAADGSLVSGIVTAGMNSDVQIVGAGSYALLLDPLPSTAIGVRGVRSNLSISYTGTSGVVSVSANELSLESASGAYATLKNISLSATSGNASGSANSLDTGSWAYSTLYNLFVIYNPTTTTSALLWSLSATAPTLPSGYTYFARIGANFTQSATNYWFISGVQLDRRFQRKVLASGNLTALPMVVSGVQGNVSTPTYVSASLTGFTPPTAMTFIGVLVAQGTGVAVAAPNGNYGAASSTTNPPPMNINTASNAASSNEAFEFVLESNSIYFASNFSGGMVAALGWEDNL